MIAARPARGLTWWREVALVVGFYAGYSVVRNLTRSDAAAAFTNAQRVIGLQQELGLTVEKRWQDWALDHHALIVGANYFYGSATFIVTTATLIHLYRRHRPDYLRLRRALLITVALAFGGYVTFPLMPPRLLDRLGDGTVFGFVDTMAAYPTPWSFASGTVDRVTNQFAAMPSLHCAFALWCAWVLVPRCRRGLPRLAAALYPLVTLVVVVITGNHYLLDAVGAVVVVVAGIVVAGWITPGAPATDLDSASSRIDEGDRLVVRREVELDHGAPVHF